MTLFRAPKFETTTQRLSYLHTYSLTRVKFRDASASKSIIIRLQWKNREKHENMGRHQCKKYNNMGRHQCKQYDNMGGHQQKKQKYGKMGKISKKRHNGLNCTQRNGEEVPRKA